MPEGRVRVGCGSHHFAIASLPHPLPSRREREIETSIIKVML
jgi:hypothetical protein